MPRQATVLLLRDEGVLRLDDPVERWVPELRGQPLATADSAPPTLRHLLSMNAGLPEDDPWVGRRSLRFTRCRLLKVCAAASSVCAARAAG